MAGRTALILGLTMLGFVCAIVVTGNQYYLPLMFWVVALVYAVTTHPRRWL